MRQIEAVQAHSKEPAHPSDVPDVTQRISYHDFACYKSMLCYVRARMTRKCIPSASMLEACATFPFALWVVVAPALGTCVCLGSWCTTARTIHKIAGIFIGVLVLPPIRHQRVSLQPRRSIRSRFISRTSSLTPWGQLSVGKQLVWDSRGWFQTHPRVYGRCCVVGRDDDSNSNTQVPGQNFIRPTPSYSAPVRHAPRREGAWGGRGCDSCAADRLRSTG